MACWILGQRGLLEVLREDLLGAFPGLGFFGGFEGRGDDVLLEVSVVGLGLLVLPAEVFECGDRFFLELVEDHGPLLEVLRKLPREALLQVVPLAQPSLRL